MDYETNVPIPGDYGAKNAKYPFSSMPVGASFFIADGKRRKISGAASGWKIRHPGWDYKTRTVDGGIRLWRIA